MNTRKPAVAGRFYPSQPERLQAELGKLFEACPPAQVQDAWGIMLPHAAYAYSGAVAAQTVAAVTIPEAVLLLGPNHTGLGVPYSLMGEGAWQIPGGTVEIDRELAAVLREGCKYLQDDASAHMYEHSIEVQLPLLYYRRSNFRMVPVVINDFYVKHFRAVGEAVARVIAACGKKVLIVASSDMSHYVPQTVIQQTDAPALAAVLERNPESLVQIVREKNVSMCGVAPVAVMLFAANALGARQARLVDYRTSGDAGGDCASVVGYAGIIVS
ncbi:MAG: AmmeMemoRadiSam system protein B [Candidatus Omnitrophica bacterium]|nr:AmmeMemoRadiSam system protein B [Candidatus Omnitrophota bacterium]